MSLLSTFASDTHAARRVIVIDSGFLGDSLHLVPALRELRRHYLKAELNVLTTPVGAQVIGLAHCVDRVWILDQSRTKRNLKDQFTVLRDLRALRFDVSINFGDADRPTIYAGMVGARQRLGRMGARRHFWSSWCLPLRGPEPGENLPVFERHRQLLGSAGFALGPAQFGLSPTPEDAVWAASLLPTTAVHLSPNSLIALKEWPVHHWVELIGLLIVFYPQLRIVVTSSPDPREVARLNAIQKAVGDDEVLFLSNTSIPRLAALMARCSAHVGSDSGPLHVAVALGIPTVSFFRDNSGIRGWLPCGPKDCVFIQPCVCVNSPSTACDPQSGPRCLAAILPEQVFAAVEKLLGYGEAETQSPRPPLPTEP